MPRCLCRTRGASYSLSVVLVVPLYLSAVLFAGEVGYLLLARQGVQYAAHAAARSASVWDTDDQPRRAAVAALAGFVGRPRDAQAGEAGIAREYAAAHGGEAVRERLFRAAAARTGVTIDRADGQVRATVRVRAPLRFPGASRFLDPDRRPPYEYPLAATVALPAGPAGGFGIDYAPGGTP